MDADEHGLKKILKILAITQSMRVKFFKYIFSSASIRVHLPPAMSIAFPLWL